MYDVVIAGGSIAGLLCAREIAKMGSSVLVLEEDHEIGTPEHCGGLVSSFGLDAINITVPKHSSKVKKAKIYSPNKKNIEIDATAQNIQQVDRRELDKQAGIQAQKNGAEIILNSKFLKFNDKTVYTNSNEFKCKQFIDARGIQALANKDKEGFLSSAQYQIQADWIDDQTIQVYLDQKLYPGFFAWIIPTGKQIAKVGVAGKKINAEKTLNEFVDKIGKYCITRKIFAPIWIKGPIKNFVSDVISIGDAAGQTKPTTAGGIYSAGMGGILAGQAVSNFINTGNKDALEQYPKRWYDIFGTEFDKQLLGRKILERLDNDTIDSLFSSISPQQIQDITASGDFDFHSGVLIKMLGVKGSLKVAQILLGSEFKKLFNQDGL